MKYRWAHFSFGGLQLAWCNLCDTAIASWTQGWGTEGLPRATRAKVDEHLAGCAS